MAGLREKPCSQWTMMVVMWGRWRRTKSRIWAGSMRGGHGGKFWHVSVADGVAAIIEGQGEDGAEVGVGGDFGGRLVGVVDGDDDEGKVEADAGLDTATIGDEDFHDPS